MNDENILMLNEQVIIKDIEDEQVAMLPGQTEMHFFEGSAREVIEELKSGPVTMGELLCGQIERFPDFDSDSLRSDLVKFLTISIDKGIIKLYGKEVI